MLVLSSLVGISRNFLCISVISNFLKQETYSIYFSLFSPTLPTNYRRKLATSKIFRSLYTSFIRRFPFHATILLHPSGTFLIFYGSRFLFRNFDYLRSQSVSIVHVWKFVGRIFNFLTKTWFLTVCYPKHFNSPTTVISGCPFPCIVIRFLCVVTCMNYSIINYCFLYIVFCEDKKYTYLSI